MFAAHVLAFLAGSRLRVDDDRVLVGLVRLTQAPTAPWSAERGGVTHHGRPR